MKKNQKNKSVSRKTLLSAIIVMIVCVAMLLGATFAWFTDSVSNTGNKIQAGTLKVQLLKNTYDGTNWTAVDISDSTEPVFAYDKWEPGYSTPMGFIVKNAGSLALKYKMYFEITGETPGTHETSTETSLLSNVLEVYKFDAAAADHLGEKLGLLKDFLAAGTFNMSGNLAPGAEDKVWSELVIKMPESAGNEYQGAAIGFDIKLAATQLTYEKDGFGNNQYDIGAPWMGGYDDAGLEANTDTTAKTVKIESAEQLASFAKKVNGGASYAKYTVSLEKDIDLSNIAWTPINYNKNDDMTFDGKGHTILHLNVSGEKNVGLFGSATWVTIKKVNVKGATLNGVAYVGVIVGSIYGEVSECKVEDAVINVTGKPDGAVYADGAKAGAIVGLLREEAGCKILNCSVKNVTINGYRDLGGIAGCIYGPNTVTGNTIEKVTINQGDYSKYEEADYTTLGAIFGRKVVTGDYPETGTIQENTGDATIKRMTIVTPGATAEETKTKVAEAITNAKAGTTIALPAVEQTLDISGSTISKAGVTIKGNDDITVKATSPANADGITFEGVDFEIGNDTYNRINGKVTYKNCSFDGLTTSYDDSTYINCTFKNSTSGKYIAHVYGGKATYEGCHFKGSNRCIFIYTDGANADVTFKNCDFTMTSKGKSAIMVNHNENNGYSTVTITKCTQTGGNADGKVEEPGETCYYYGLWGIKHVTAGQLRATITVDGVEQYKYPTE